MKRDKVCDEGISNSKVIELPARLEGHAGNDTNELASRFTTFAAVSSIASGNS